MYYVTVQLRIDADNESQVMDAVSGLLRERLLAFDGGSALLDYRVEHMRATALPHAQAIPAYDPGADQWYVRCPVCTMAEWPVEKDDTGAVVTCDYCKAVVIQFAFP